MSRNLDFRKQPFQPYAKALGECVLAWNDFHMVLSSLFGTVSGIPNRITPDTMWNALTSDRAQREMLEAVINLNAIGYNIPKPLRAEMKWVLERARSLEDFRNSLIHSPIFKNGTSEITPWHHLGHQRAKKLEGKDVLKLAKWFYESVIILREYTEKLNEAFDLILMRSPNISLPKRPSLPNRGDAK